MNLYCKIHKISTEIKSTKMKSEIIKLMVLVLNRSCQKSKLFHFDILTLKFTVYLSYVCSQN